MSEPMGNFTQSCLEFWFMESSKTFFAALKWSCSQKQRIINYIGLSTGVCTIKCFSDVIDTELK
jgi:hypothetical protein